MRIGIIPVPIYVILVALLAGFTYTGDIKGEVSMMIAVLVIGGFTCAEIGKRIPVLRNIGAAAIFATFIPSALAYYKLLPPQIEKSIIEFTKYTNFLYLFIACIIVGSILGMDRQVLVKGFLKIFVPLAVGSIVAGIVGTLVGTLLGLGAYHTFFFVVVPIMAGGVGEGAIPLSVGYSEILGQPQGDVFAQVLPPVMLGSLTAILLAGTLNFVGKRYPHLTGEGRLQPGEHDDMDTAREDDGRRERRADRRQHCRSRRSGSDHALSLGRHVPPPVRLAGAGRHAVPRGAREADERGLAASAAGRLRRLQVLFDGRNLSAPVRNRRVNDAVGQADGGIQSSQSDHDRQHGGDIDGDWARSSDAGSTCTRSRRLSSTPVTAGRAGPATSPFSRPPIGCNLCRSPRSRRGSEARSR